MNKRIQAKRLCYAIGYSEACEKVAVLKCPECKHWFCNDDYLLAPHENEECDDIIYKTQRTELEYE